MSQSKYVLDLTGDKYGKWSVLEFAGVNERKKSLWTCICECGETRIVAARTLRNGTSTSCGCNQKELVSKMFKTHGASNTKLHEAWRHMMTRCYNENSEAYQWYGARGIIVEGNWHTFENFLQDNAEYETSKLTLDRIDNNGNYSKENTRWVSMKVQQNNRRNNILIEFDGLVKTMKEWSEYFRIPYQTLVWRIRTAKWDLTRAFEVVI